MYRDTFPHCPRCRSALEEAGAAAGCRECRGVWIGEPLLDEMMRVMHRSPAPPRFDRRAADGALPCPTCGTTMTSAHLEGVAVERCARGHGVWFDDRELETALRLAGEHEPPAPPPADVPDVRVGVGAALIRAIGGLLANLGYGVLAIVTAPVRSRR